MAVTVRKSCWNWLSHSKRRRNGVGVGQPHINDCDVEQCSVCGGQRASCECKGHHPQRAMWTGEFPWKTEVSLKKAKGQ